MIQTEEGPKPLLSPAVESMLALLQSQKERQGKWQFPTAELQESAVDQRRAQMQEKYVSVLELGPKLPRIYGRVRVAGKLLWSSADGEAAGSFAGIDWSGCKQEVPESKSTNAKPALANLSIESSPDKRYIGFGWCDE
jgi:hypothetical protein